MGDNPKLQVTAMCSDRRMAQKTATVELNENGRCTIPAEVRRALDIDGEKAIVEVTVTTDE
jgi:bifunctional DNA-binding transcriptional regulator/antitoxin component of YhaV-PrlF toxin-antitoxin module